MKKTMKVVLSLALVLALALTMVACGGKPSGKYYMKSMKMDGKEIDFEEMLGSLAALDPDADKDELKKMLYIEFKDNGTGVMDMAGDTTEFTWSGNTMDADGEKQDFKVKGNSIVISDGEGNEVVFQK